MTPEQKQRIEQIERWLMLHVSANSDPYTDRARAFGELHFLLSLVNEQEAQTAGLNLLRQLVSGKNSLRTLGVFSCNQAEHEDVDCECFWEQCEAWAKADAETATPPQ